MTSKKILYDHQVFFYWRYGGQLRYFYELIKHGLKSERIEISLFEGLYSARVDLKNRKDDFARYWGIKNLDFLGKNKAVSIINRSLFSCFRFNQSFDVYHPTLYLDLYTHFKGKRVITIHDLAWETIKQFDVPSFSELVKKAIGRADKVMAVSEQTKKDLIEYYKVPEGKIKVTYLANSLKVKPKEERIVKEEYILYVGIRRGHKNFAGLFDTYKNSTFLKSNFRLVCFGAVTVSDEESKMIRESSLLDRITFLGGGDNVLANLYKYASVFVFPSYYEGFGIPPLEAMYYDCPVLSSSRGSLPEVVGDAGLYFDPDKREEMGEKLEKILTDTNLRNELIAKGKMQEKKFSWEKCFNETLDVYLE